MSEKNDSNSPIRNAFNSLKTTIVGTKTSQIDSTLDNAIRDISAYRSQSARASYIEIIRKMTTTADVSKLFDNMTANDSPLLYGQSTRFGRYKAYEAIIYYISYCKMAIQVITDNILSPDDITKSSLDVIELDSFGGDESVKKSRVLYVENLIKKTKLENIIENVIKNTLGMGDVFVEITSKKNAITSTAAILTEALNINEYTHPDIVMNSKYDLFEYELPNGENLEVILDASGYVDEKEIKEDDISLLMYDPNRVVKLQSNAFPVCFGYLVFPISSIAPQEAVKDKDQGINTLCQNILNSLQHKINDFDSDGIDKKDLEEVISKLLANSDAQKTVTVRYVSEKNMQHFKIPSTRMYPYGESIIEPTQFNAKVLIML